MKLRILLADDHEIVRRGLCSLLQKHEGWEVCGKHPTAAKRSRWPSN
jgi:DNA-binding NarL/FixJ family response regulator